MRGRRRAVRGTGEVQCRLDLPLCCALRAPRDARAREGRKGGMRHGLCALPACTHSAGAGHRPAPPPPLRTGSCIRTRSPSIHPCLAPFTPYHGPTPRSPPRLHELRQQPTSRCAAAAAGRPCGSQPFWRPAAVAAREQRRSRTLVHSVHGDAEPPTIISLASGIADVAPELAAVRIARRAVHARDRSREPARRE